MLFRSAEEDEGERSDRLGHERLSDRRHGRALARGRAVVGFVRRAERVLELVDELARYRQRFFLNRVVDPGSLAAGGHQPGAAECPEVLRDARLAVGQVVLQVTDAEWPTCRDPGEELEPHRVSQRPEHLDSDVAGLGDDPRCRERARGEYGQRAGNGGLWFGHGRSVIGELDKKWLKITLMEYRLASPTIGGADGAMRVELRVCDSFGGSVSSRRRAYLVVERREQL